MNRKGFLRLTKKTLASTLVISTVIVGTGLIYLFSPFSVKNTGASWFNEDWGYRKAITFTHNASVSTPSQVELDIDTTGSPDTFQPDCGDVRFTDAGGNLLRYYLDSGAGACDTSSTDFDVLMPTVINGGNLIYMYYGNPSAIDGTEAADFSDATTTPSGGAAAAGSEEKGSSPTLYWKLDDATVGTAQDSTANGLDGTHNNTPSIKTEDFCVSSKCLYFDGANNENISKSDDAKLDFASSDNFTLQAWVKRSGVSSAVNYILTKAQTGYTGYKLYMDASGDFCFDVSDGTSTDSACTSAIDFDDDSWHFVTGVKAATTSITLYVDGLQRAQDATIAATGTLVNTGTFYAGVDLDGTTNEWLGYIDELKVYRDNTARTASQIKADYKARGNPDASANLGANTQNLPGALSNGLLGYWKMDETSWTNDCSTDTVLDSSGNSFNGDACPATTGPTGNASTRKYGNAGGFDGTDDYVNIGNQTTLDLTDGQDMTIAGWFYRDTFNSQDTLLAKRNGTGPAAVGYMVFIDSGTDDLYLDVSDGTDEYFVRTTGNQFNSSSWNYFVITWDEDNAANTQIYINGNLSPTSRASDISSVNSPSNSVNVTIGAESDQETPYAGKLDGLRIYKRALSALEASQLYNFAPGPVGHWKMDENTGTAAEDSSGYDNELTLTNSPTWTNGKFGAGLSFAGSDSHVTRTDDSDFDFGTGASFTYQAWVKHNTASAQEMVLAKYDSTAGNGGFKLYMESDGDLTCGIDDDETSFPEDSATSTAATYDDNIWHFVTCVKDGTSGLYLYIDGVLVSSDISISSTGDFANADPLYIGIAEDGISNDWVGRIDDVKIYNYARNTKQTVEDLNGGHPAPGSPVGSALGHWRFDEGADNKCSGGVNDICNSGSQGSALDGVKSGTIFRNLSAVLNKSVVTTGISSYLQIPDHDSIDFSAGQDFTVSFWFLDEGPNSNNTGIVDKSPSGAGAYPYAFRYNSNSSVTFSRSDGTNTPTVVGTKAVTDSAWHQITGVKEGSTLKLYIDGVLNLSGTDTTSSTTTNSTALYLGTRAGGATGYSANFDELKIYNFALTPAQIAQDRNLASSQILGALGNNSSYEKNAANQELCVPGDSAACSAPVAIYEFEENAGQTAYDTRSSTDNLDAVLGISSSSGSDDPTWTSGKFGSALHFNGTSQFATIPDSGAIELDFTTVFTIEAWIKLEALGQFQAILGKHLGSTNNRSYDVFINSSNELAVRIDSDGSFGNNYVFKTTPSPAFETGKWYHIAAVWNASGSDGIYINGIPQTLTTTGTKPASAANKNNDILIGATEDGSTGLFWGIIDHILAFAYARTPAQIAWNYNKGKPLAHLRMDECQGTTLNDASGNSFSGTLTIGATGSEDTVGTCVTSSTAWGNGVTGKRNYSVDLDGTDDYIQVSDNANLRFDEATKDFSLFAWVKRGTNGEMNIISKEDADNDGYRLQFTSGNLVRCSVDAIDLDSSITITDTNWHLVGCTIDRDGNGQVYIDGQTNGTATAISSEAMANTSNLLIGTRSYTSANYLDGQIDDVKIFNYALTPTQVKTLYNEGAVSFGPSSGAP